MTAAAAAISAALCRRWGVWRRLCGVGSALKLQCSVSNLPVTSHGSVANLPLSSPLAGVPNRKRGEAAIEGGGGVVWALKI